MQGKILKILGQTTTVGDGGYTEVAQTMQIQILDGNDRGKIITITQQNDARISKVASFSQGQTVVIDKAVGNGNSQYTINDTDRIPSLILLALIFFAFTMLIAGKKGIGAIFGLCISLAIIIGYILPQMLYNQADPLTVSVIGSFLILFITTFVAHGFSKQTAIAVASTFLALLATYFFAVLSVDFAHLIGLGTEDSYLLELAPGQAINPQGLLLGGIIIGTLGALNDVTTTQVSAVFAVFRANPTQTFWHLIQHGITIGREHIVSLVNTLVLAYAGTSLPIFIFILVNPQHLPLWVMINNQQISEEIVRTVAGSMGLMLAVPIATLLASYLAPYFAKNGKEDAHATLHVH